MMVKLIAAAAVLAVAGKLVARELPGMRRYQKISTM
jgi:hypothetical protein